MIRQVGFYLHKYFGLISHFKELSNNTYIFVKPIAGFVKDDIKITYTYNNLLKIEGHIIKKGNNSDIIIYSKQIYELIQMPNKCNKEQTKIIVKDGLLYIMAYKAKMSSY